MIVEMETSGFLSGYKSMPYLSSCVQLKYRFKDKLSTGSLFVHLLNHSVNLQ